jgi:hypothetical protein
MVRRIYNTYTKAGPIQLLTICNFVQTRLQGPMAEVTIAIGTPESCRYRVVMAQFPETFNGDGIDFNESNFPVLFSKKRGVN